MIECKFTANADKCKACEHCKQVYGWIWCNAPDADFKKEILIQLFKKTGRWLTDEEVLNKIVETLKANEHYFMDLLEDEMIEAIDEAIESYVEQALS